MTNRSVPLAVALLFCTVGLASAGREAAPAGNAAPAANAEGSEYPVYVVEPGKDPEAPVRPFVAQIAAYRKEQKVAEDFKIRVSLKHYFEMGKGEHDMVRTIVPLNPQGKAEGVESTYQEYVGLIHTCEYKDGLKDGVEREYTPQKRYLRVETPWKAGKIEGVRKVLHPSGKSLAETPYVAGLEEGESKSFDDEGGLVRKVTLKAGKREGDLIDYWPKTDKPKRIVPYKAGKIDGVVKDFYLDGKVKSETPFRNNLAHGIATDLEPDGKVRTTVYWIDGDKVSKEDFEKKAKR